MTDLPLLAVWEQSGAEWQMVGQVLTYESVSAGWRHRQPGVWSLRMPYNDQAKAITKRRAVTIDFRSERFTGLVETLSPQSDETGRPVLEVSGSGALALLGDAICYPDPSSGAGAQLVTHYRATGPAETVLRQLVVAQFVSRQGRSLTVPTSSGRGSGVTVNLFFDNLLDVVMKQARKGGLGLRMGLVNTTSSTRAEMRLTFAEGVDRSASVRLSNKVGSLRSWKQTDTLPQATRAAVGAAIVERPITIASVTGNTLTTSGAHGLKTGSLIRFRGKGDPPAPLDDGTSYFAVRVDSNTFKVAKTRAKALAGTTLDLTNVGSGTIKVTEVARVVGEYVMPGAEDEWGRQRETFVDARDEDSDDTSVFADKGSEALDDMVEQSSFELEAVEAEGMRYGTHYNLGDMVTVELMTGLSTVERLNGVTLTADTNGVQVALVPGNPDAANPMFKQAAIIRSLRARLRNLEQQED